jgi:hypothetical protein
MDKSTNDSQKNADAYYGDDDANTDELDLSFLDEDDSSDAPDEQE